MKYFAVLFFNIIAFYILAVFIFGNGGMIDSVKKVQEVGKLEKQKLASETEIEDLKARLNYLHSLKGPNAAALISQGKKVDNLVIFKFIDQKSALENAPNNDNSLIVNRIYFCVFLIAFLIISGNIVLLINFKKKPAT